MANSIDPDETAHYEPSHLNLCCLQKPITMACGSEKVKPSEYRNNRKYWDSLSNIL